jgi:hypothetical protein
MSVYGKVEGKPLTELTITFVVVSPCDAAEILFANFVSTATAE